MVDNPIHPPKALSSESNSIRRAKLQAQLSRSSRRTMQQIAAKQAFKSFCASGFNQPNLTRKFKSLDDLAKTRKKQEAEKADKETEVIEAAQEIGESASSFSDSNPELLKRTLMLLRENIQDSDSIEEILNKVLEFYPDLSLADEALDFLIQTTKGNLHGKCIAAKELLNSQHEREIKAGKNIHLQAREFSEKGLGSPTALRDMYREVTGNPRTANELFDELTSQFTFKNMKKVIDFLLHSLGADLKSKGPSISRGELSRLIDETRSLQAILGVYRFFASRMNLVNSQFSQNGLSVPKIITFEEIAKAFMQLLAERYISSDKVLHLSRLLGISKDLIAQIIVYTQMRDAVRQTAPKLYKNKRQKEDVLTSILEALEELEDELEEDEAEE